MKCEHFPVFVFILVLLMSELNLCLCSCRWQNQVFTARNVSLCPSLLSGSLEWLDYKVNSTGTEDNSILLK